MSIKPGIYEHFKGGRYTVLGIVFDSTNGADHKEMVHYVSHSSGLPFVRDLSEFLSSATVQRLDGMSRDVPRFRLVTEFKRPT